MSDQIPDAELIRKYRDIRAHIQTRTKAHSAELAPYKQAQDVIEVEFSRRFNERGVNSVSCDDGTAYRSTTMSVRTADKSAFVDWAFEQDLIRDMDIRPAKEAVKSWIEENGAPPPGVDVTMVHAVNFRK